MPVPFKLTSEQRKIIAERYAAGEGTTTLAREFGVKDASISGVVKRLGGKMRTVAEGTRKLALDQTVFDEVTEASAYWAGFLMADGTIVAAGRTRAARISLVLKRSDEAHIQKFKEFLKSGHKITYQTAITARCPNPSHSAGIEVSSNRIAKSLAKFGVTPRKSLREHVLLLENNRDFWRGYIDGDGSLGFWNRKSPGIVMYGGMSLVEQFRKFVWLEQPDRKLTVNLATKIPSVRLSSSHAVFLAKRLYENSTISLDRKRVIAEKMYQGIIR